MTEVSFSNLSNALSSIVVTPSGIVTETRFLFPINNLLPITVTGLPLISFGMSYDVTVSLSVALVIFTPPFPSLSYVRIASEAAGSWSAIALLPLITVLTLLQFLKASVPTVVTPLPIVIDSSLEQLLNASSPIEVTFSPIVTDLSPLYINVPSLIEVTFLLIVTELRFVQFANA